jgi:hypothetical protein
MQTVTLGSGTGPSSPQALIPTNPAIVTIVRMFMASLPLTGQAEAEGESRQAVITSVGETGMTPAGPAEITVLLKAWGDGDQAAFDRLATLVYHDLLRTARSYMKNERAGNTL